MIIKKEQLLRMSSSEFSEVFDGKGVRVKLQNAQGNEECFEGAIQELVFSATPVGSDIQPEPIGFRLDTNKDINIMAVNEVTILA